MSVEPRTRVDIDPGDRAVARPVGPAEGRGRPWPVAVPVLAVALAVSPVVVAALALIGDSWVPMSDWSSLLYRVSQVGTTETPLVGPYSFHGFAHPGPLLYWVTAPLYRLTGEDPRSLLWTGGLVNVATVGAMAAVAWRRGRWPLLLGVLTLVAVLVHHLGPEVMVDMWNPHVALLPFLLAVLLLWDAGLGRRRAVLAAAVPATFAVQAHLAYLFLTALVVAWLVAWTRWQDRTRRDPAQAGEADATPPGPGPRAGADPDPTPGRPAAGWAELRRPLLVILGLLWLAPALDAVFDLHNPVNMLGALGSGDATVGPVDAVGMVGHHVRVSSLWATGAEVLVPGEPSLVAGAVHVVVLLAALAGCLHVARRRGLVDAAALVTLAATLLVGSVPATSQLITPTPSYLTKWLTVVGGLAWFAVAWTGWRVVEPRVRAPARPSRLRVAGALAAAVLVAATAWSWPEASRTSPPHGENPEAILAVRSALLRELPRDRTYRVDVVGDTTAHFTGFIYWLIHDGFRVLTTDGNAGLKWGHEHRLSDGEHYDTALTVAVRTPWSLLEPYLRCHDDRSVRPVVAYDGLDPEERAWLDGVAWRLLADPGSLTAEEEDRAARLSSRNVQITVFQGSAPCGKGSGEAAAPAG